MYHMRVKIDMQKPLALLLALVISICQPAMTVLAAETGINDSPDTPFELSQASPFSGDAVKLETESQSDETVTVQSQAEAPAEGGDGIPEPEEPELEESQPEEPEPSQPEPGEGEGETSEPEKPEESKPERPEESLPEEPGDGKEKPEESEPKLPEESLPEISEPELPEELLPKLPELELPAIPLPEVEKEVVEEQEPVITTAPLGVPRFQARTFGIMPFSTGDGSVAKLVADNHVVMLRADGRLLVWGDNTHGQLGLGPGAAQKVYAPTQNMFFKDKKVKDIAVVQDATFVLLNSGELYAFGKGTNGRLGLGNNTNVSTPTLIPGSQGLRINGLYPMKESMVVTTDNNAIYVWGRNDKGQLGDGTKVDKNTPTRIMEVADVKSLYVGDDYAILIKQDDTMSIWGSNANGVFPYDSSYRVTSSNKGSTSLNSATKRQWSDQVGWRDWTSDANATVSTQGSVTSSQPNVNSVQTILLNLNESLNSISPGASSYIPNAESSYSSGTRPSVRTREAYWDYSNDKGEYVYQNVTYTLTGSGSANKKHSMLSVSYSGSASWSESTTQTIGNTKWQFQASASQSCSWSLAPNYLDFSNSSVVGNITHIMPGSKHWYMIQDGQLYSQGDNSNKQQSKDQTSGGYLSTAQTIRAYINALDASGDSFGELVVAGDTNYIITGNGDVHAWGGNPSGKTGTGLTASFVETPTAVYSLNGKSIASIVAGRNSTLFVSHTGDVYAVGDNLHGQLGLGEEFADETNISMPQKIDTFRFSATELPPDAPDTVEAPEEVEAGTPIIVKWKAANKAVAYELQRTVSLKGDEEAEAQMFATRLFSFSPLSTDDLGLEVSEVVYNGEETQYKDTAQSNWDTVTYAVKALNSIGDYSPEKATNTIAVKAGNTPQPTEDTTPPILTITTDAASKTINITAIDTESGMEGIYVNDVKRGTDSASYVISAGETVAIYGKDNAGNTSATQMISYTDVVGKDNNGNNNNNNGGNNTGGLTDKQLLAILAAITSNNSGGIDSDAILTLAAAMRRSSSPVVNNNSGTDEALLRALIEGNRNSGAAQNTPQEIIRYVQTGNGDSREDALSPEILSLLLSQLQGSESAGNGSNSYDLLSAFLLIKLLSDGKDTQQPEYSPAPQGTSMAVGIILAVLTVVMVLMSVAFPLTVFYFNRKVKTLSGGPRPDDQPDDGVNWKQMYNETAKEYNDLVDMVTKAEQPEGVAQAQE